MLVCHPRRQRCLERCSHHSASRLYFKMSKCAQISCSDIQQCMTCDSVAVSFLTQQQTPLLATTGRAQFTTTQFANIHQQRLVPSPLPLYTSPPNCRCSCCCTCGGGISGKSAVSIARCGAAGGAGMYLQHSIVKILKSLCAIGR